MPACGTIKHGGKILTLWREVCSWLSSQLCQYIVRTCITQSSWSVLSNHANLYWFLSLHTYSVRALLFWSPHPLSVCHLSVPHQISKTKWDRCKICRTRIWCQILHWKYLNSPNVTLSPKIAQNSLEAYYLALLSNAACLCCIFVHDVTIWHRIIVNSVGDTVENFLPILNTLVAIFQCVLTVELLQQILHCLTGMCWMAEVDYYSGLKLLVIIVCCFTVYRHCKVSPPLYDFCEHAVAHSVHSCVTHQTLHSFSLTVQTFQWWISASHSVFKHSVENIHQLQQKHDQSLEAIQRLLAICRMWPWTLTYQKFLLCISSQGQNKNLTCTFTGSHLRAVTDADDNDNAGHHSTSTAATYLQWINLQFGTVSQLWHVSMITFQHCVPYTMIHWHIHWVHFLLFCVTIAV